jgi:penicillin-binding protein 1A
MGRDDNKAVPGLQGGRNPARAFAQFMTVAVAKRPIEKFQTDITLPEWQLEPDEEAYFGNADEPMAPDGSEGGVATDPMDQSGEDRVESPDTNPAPRLDQKWIDEALGRNNPRMPPRTTPPGNSQAHPN